MLRSVLCEIEETVAVVDPVIGCTEPEYSVSLMKSPTGSNVKAGHVASASLSAWVDFSPREHLSPGVFRLSAIYRCCGGDGLVIVSSSVKWRGGHEDLRYRSCDALIC